MRFIQQDALYLITDSAALRVAVDRRTVLPQVIDHIGGKAVLIADKGTRIIIQPAGQHPREGIKVREVHRVILSQLVTECKPEQAIGLGKPFIQHFVLGTGIFFIHLLHGGKQHPIE